MTKAPERRAKLNKRTVDAAKPEAARYILWDVTLAGFGVRVEPTGRKTFIARYRAGGGRAGIRRQATLGQYGALTVDEAAKAAKKLLGKAAGGGDPLGERLSARRAGATVAKVCDWYLEEAEAGRLLGRRGRPIKASTIAMDRSRIETHVKPRIGSKAVASLSVADLEGMQAAIAVRQVPLKPEKGKRRKRGGTTTGGSGVASRTLGMLRTIFAHAARAGVITTNPAVGARKIAGSGRTRRLSIEEIGALGTALREAKDENADAVAAIRFTLLSGFRRNEVLSIRGRQVIAAGGVDFADTKSGPQVRPIGKAALDVLQKQAKAHPGNEAWLFPAERGDGHFVGIRKVLQRIARQADLAGVTPHTLRHTFASVAGELGYSHLVIGDLLGHRAAGNVTAGYVHLDAIVVAAATRVAGVIANALDGYGATVVPIASQGGGT